MVEKIRKALRQFATLFRRYPRHPGVHPDSFRDIESDTSDVVALTGLIAIQSVPDPLYFLLFGALRQYLGRQTSRAELVVVRSINAAFGQGVLAAVKRSFFMVWLYCRPWERAYGNLIDDVGYRSAGFPNLTIDAADWKHADRLWEQMRQQQDNYIMNVDGLEVGDLIVDSYLRFRPSPRFQVDDPFVKTLIWQAVREVRRARAYFRDRKPVLYLTSYSTYLEHGIPVRAALAEGVVVWSFGSLVRVGKRLTCEDSYHTPDYSNYRTVFEQLCGKEQCLEEAKTQLQARLSGSLDMATSYMRRSAYENTATDLPHDLSGAVVVFLHDFYDSPHIYPDLVFCDFWQWICFTIDTLQSAGIPFYLKPHPNQISKSEEALQELQKIYPSLKWLPVNASNVMLVEAGIVCGVTMYGTVAHELAYLGIHSIACARHPHHSFEFCRTAKNKNEYKGLLESPGQRPLEVDEMKRQALAFYYMHNIHGDQDANALRKAFVEFWAACNRGDATDKKILSAFHQLVGLPAFKEMANRVAAVEFDSENAKVAA